MTKMKYAAFLGFMLASSVAFAQAPPPVPNLSAPQSVAPELQSVVDDWTLLAGQQKHFVESMQKLVQSYNTISAQNEQLRAEINKLKAPASEPEKK